MKAIGRDGRWHDWDNLSAEEQKDWMDAMTVADNIHERQKKQNTKYSFIKTKHYEQAGQKND